MRVCGLGLGFRGLGLAVTRVEVYVEFRARALLCITIFATLSGVVTVPAVIVNRCYVS